MNKYDYIIDGKVINKGEVLNDKHGRRYEFIEVTSEGTRIYVRDIFRGMNREFFPSVFNGTIELHRIDWHSQLTPRSDRIREWKEKEYDK